jgi:hypothetical protein
MQLGSGNGEIYLAIPLILSLLLPRGRFRSDLAFVVFCV